MVSGTEIRKSLFETTMFEAVTSSKHLNSPRDGRKGTKARARTIGSADRQNGNDY